MEILNKNKFKHRVYETLFLRLAIKAFKNFTKLFARKSS